MLYAIFGKAGEDVKDDSLKAPAGMRGVVIDTKRFTRRSYVTDEEKAKNEAKAKEVEVESAQEISTLIKNQSDGDLYRLYTTSRRDKVDFNVASIPPSFDYKADSEFDKGYMNALFNLGYQLGSQGYSWDKVPPGLSN